MGPAGTGGKGGSGGSGGRGGGGPGGAGGAPGSGGAAGDAGGGATIQMKMAWWGSADRAMRTQKVVEMFEAKNPGIKIATEYKTITAPGAVGTAYWPTMLDYQMKGTLPDIMQQDYAYLEEWTQRGDLRPLDDYVMDKTVNLDDVPAALLPGMKVGGKIMAITLGINTPAVALDLELLAKHNIPVPNDEWTWDDFERIALDIRAKAGIWGFGRGVFDYTPGWKSVIMSKGWWVWSADNKTLGYTDDGPWIEHWKMALRLQAAGAIPNLSQEPRGNIDVAPIVSKQAGMEHLFSNQIVAMTDAADKASMAAGGTARNLKMLPMPRVKGGVSPAYMRPSQYFSVTATSKYPKEAARLIDFFTNDVEANKILAAERGVPISTKVLAGIKSTVSKAAGDSFDLIERAAKYAAPVPPNDPPPWSKINTEILQPRTIPEIMWKAVTPEQGVANFRRDAIAMLMGGSPPDAGLPDVPDRAEAGAPDSGPGAYQDANFPEASLDAAVDAGADVPPADAGVDAGVDTADAATDAGQIGRALLVVGAIPLEPSDVPLQTRLEAASLGVDIVLDSAATAAMATDKKVVIISASSATANVTNKFRTVAVPVMVLEPNIYDDMGLTAAPAAAHDTTEQTQITILDATNSLAAGLTGNVAVYTATGGVVWGVPAAAAVKVASVLGQAGQTAIFAYAAAAQMVDLVAPAKRMGFFLHDSTPPLTADGLKLLDAAIAWLIVP